MRYICIILVVGLTLLGEQPVWGAVAHAHDWYPHECCHDQDCAVVTLLERLPDGRLLVETQHAVGTVPRGFAIRPSPDGQAHACLRQNGSDVEHYGWVVIYLFIPGVS